MQYMQGGYHTTQGGRVCICMPAVSPSNAQGGETRATMCMHTGPEGRENRGMYIHARSVSVMHRVLEKGYYHTRTERGERTEVGTYIPHAHRKGRENRGIYVRA